MWRVFFTTAFVFCSSACWAQSQEERVALILGRLMLENAGLAAQVKTLFDENTALKAEKNAAGGNATPAVPNAGGKPQTKSNP